MVTDSRVFEVPFEDYPGDAGRAPAPGGDLLQRIGSWRDDVGDATVWHVNSTPDGGGVAELLKGYLRRHNALGVRTRWLVADGSPEFFAITKSLYFMLYGVPAEDMRATREDAEHYCQVTAQQARLVTEYCGKGDTVVLHDSQTTGMAPLLNRAGLRVIWQCHIGSTDESPEHDAAWKFLAPYLDDIDGFIFSMRDYVPSFLPSDKVAVIMPAIDPLSPKNRLLDGPLTGAVLEAAGLAPPDGPKLADLAPFLGRGRAELESLTSVTQDAPIPPGAPVVVQVSRWDPVKDMHGVLAAFGAAEFDDVHLVLAGPDPALIADDPRAKEVLADVDALRRSLDPVIRRRVHLVALSGADFEGSAFIVNALQQRADVVVQKSLREGFGLTVAEGKWKSKPVIGGAVGGIPLQITPGRTGLLVDPTDISALTRALIDLIGDPARRCALGNAAHDDVGERFLIDRQLAEYVDVYRTVSA
jgi:trehalose synthase